VYVCGPSASAAGLTLSVNKNGGEFSLEAGALVTADRGVCCVDEFDKVSTEHGSLLGAMEQQEVTVAKAGLVASLPARATIIAAANPLGGHYNKSNTLAQNLKMSPAMISRFDLVFLMLDNPDEETDKRLAGHILTGQTMSSSHKSLPGSLSQQSDERTSKQSLRSRLQVPIECDPLPPQLFRKLVAYARQYVHPKLSTDAKEIIKSYYLKLRQRSAGDVSSPAVTHRLLESIVRLSEARARLELREEVTGEDALDALDIMGETLCGSLHSGPDTILFDGHAKPKRGNSKGARFRQERDRYMKALQRHCQQKDSKEIAVHELFTIADQIELAVEDTSGFLEYLNELGDILKKGNSMFQYNGRL
jgi:DNA helicase MCM8